MPHYISLIKWTDQGIRNAKESPKRADAAKGVVQKLGGKMQLFYTMGEYDIVAITEAPNDEAAFQAILQIGAQGNVRTTTMKAWTLEEASRVLGKLQ